jgi:transcriptional regulator GlxA family with amidase domain
MNTQPKWIVGVLLFDGVDVLDFTAPMEIFTMTTYKAEEAVAMMMSSSEEAEKPFTVRTVSCDGGAVRGSNGLHLVPDYSFENAPAFDILLVPGAFGQPIQQALQTQLLIGWLAEQGGRVPLIVSVCTGALLLAAAGLIEGKPATTNLLALDLLEKTFPNVQVVRDSKVVDAGNVITGQGPSTGIDVGLHVVERLLGVQVAECTAASIEYKGNLLQYLARKTSPQF